MKHVRSCGALTFGIRKVMYEKCDIRAGPTTTLLRPALSNNALEKKLIAIENTPRNMASMFDQLIFYWNECPDDKAFDTVKNDGAIASAWYLLKIVSQLWENQLEFIA